MSDQRALPRPADVLLADGRIAAIRPMVAADRDGLMALHDAAGDESLRLRFFALNREASHQYVDHLVGQSGDTVATLVQQYLFVPAKHKVGRRGGRVSPRPPSSCPTRNTGTAWAACSWSTSLPPAATSGSAASWPTCSPTTMG